MWYIDDIDRGARDRENDFSHKTEGKPAIFYNLGWTLKALC